MILFRCCCLVWVTLFVVMTISVCLGMISEAINLNVNINYSCGKRFSISGSINYIFPHWHSLPTSLLPPPFAPQSTWELLLIFCCSWPKLICHDDGNRTTTTAALSEFNYDVNPLFHRMPSPPSSSPLITTRVLMDSQGGWSGWAKRKKYVPSNDSAERARRDLLIYYWNMTEVNWAWGEGGYKAGGGWYVL